MTSDFAAEEIADEILFLTGKAIREGHFEHFRVHFLLPQLIETLSGSKLLQTENDIRDIFDGVQSQMLKNKVVDIVRTIHSADFIDTDTIGSTHISSMIRADGTPLSPAYPTYSILKRVSGEWKIASSRVVILSGNKMDDVLIDPSPGGVSSS
ncbi:MAG: hypothetical protein AAF514_06630 [Verrucomicrobiota bacterium]